MTLTEFLLARIAEDKALAKGALRDDLGFRRERGPQADDGRWSTSDGHFACEVSGVGLTIYDEGGHTPEQAAHIARHDPARVLAECEAKRRIVAWDAEQYVGYGILELLALPYADHPDYNEAWKP